MEDDDDGANNIYDELPDPDEPEPDEPEPPRPAPKVKMVKQNSVARKAGRLDLSSVLAVPGGGKAHEDR